MPRSSLTWRVTPEEKHNQVGHASAGLASRTPAVTIQETAAKLMVAEVRSVYAGARESQAASRALRRSRPRGSAVEDARRQGRLFRVLASTLDLLDLLVARAAHQIDAERTQRLRLPGHRLVRGHRQAGQVGVGPGQQVGQHAAAQVRGGRSEEHTSELQSPCNLV